MAERSEVGGVSAKDSGKLHLDRITLLQFNKTTHPPFASQTVPLPLQVKAITGVHYRMKLRSVACVEEKRTGKDNTYDNDVRFPLVKAEKIEYNKLSPITRDLYERSDQTVEGKKIRACFHGRTDKR